MKYNNRKQSRQKKSNQQNLESKVLEQGTFWSSGSELINGLREDAGSQLCGLTVNEKESMMIL